jgi:hypothetical protein
MTPCMGYEGTVCLYFIGPKIKDYAVGPISLETLKSLSVCEYCSCLFLLASL